MKKDVPWSAFRHSHLSLNGFVNILDYYYSIKYQFDTLNLSDVVCKKPFNILEYVKFCIFQILQNISFQWNTIHISNIHYMEFVSIAAPIFLNFETQTKKYYQEKKNECSHRFSKIFESSI